MCVGQRYNIQPVNSTGDIGGRLGHHLLWGPIIYSCSMGSRSLHKNTEALLKHQQLMVHVSCRCNLQGQLPPAGIRFYSSQWQAPRQMCRGAGRLSRGVTCQGTSHAGMQWGKACVSPSPPQCPPIHPPQGPLKQANSYSPTHCKTSP